MSARTLSPATYLMILAVLLILTVTTVAVSFMPLDGSWHIALGLSIALVKAALVILFFMHLFDSPRLTWAVVLLAATWLMILLILTFCDYVSRGDVPHMPGH